MRIHLLLGTAALLASGVLSAAPETIGSMEPPPAMRQQTPLERGRANYEAILRGEKTLFDLSPAEQEEVRELDRRARAQPPPSDEDAYERCIDQEYARLDREPSALDQRSIETRCR